MAQGAGLGNAAETRIRRASGSFFIGQAQALVQNVVVAVSSACGCVVLSRNNVLRLLAFSALSLGSATAVLAGAFPQTAGETQVISSWFFSASSVAFNSDGLLARAPALRSHDVSTLLEYGYDADTTLIFKPSFQRLDLTAPSGTASRGLATIEAGVRRRLGILGDVTLSAQAFSRLMPDDDARFAAPSRLQLEAGLAGGLPFSLFPGSLLSFTGFVDVSASLVKQIGGAQDEVRAEATLGFQSSERMLVLYQVFSVWSLQGAVPGGPYRRHKVQSSVVYLVTPQWRVQLGIFATVAGATTRYERGVMSALWRRF
jgi:hypothetical protein